MPFPKPSRIAWLASLGAVLSFAAALVALLVWVPAYQPAQHPFALMGALRGAAAAWFNLAAFLVPGVLVGLALALLPEGLTAGRAGGVGRQLGMMAALGFVLMGVFPLDLDDLAGVGARAHGTVWMIWLAAVVPSALCLGVGAWRAGQQRVIGVASLLAGALIGLLCLVGIGGLSGPSAQLLAWALWLGWIALLARSGDKRMTAESI